MQVFKRIFLIISCAFIFARCSWFQTNEIKIVETNFSEEVEATQNLTFRFDRAIVQPADAGGTNWETATYLQFNPPLEGRYRWVSSTELLFSPTKPFRPNTQYTCKPAPALLEKFFSSLPSPQRKKAKEEKISLSADVIRFHTPYLQLEKAVSYWTKGPSGPEVRLALDFNYPVEASEVAKLTQVQFGNTTAGNPTEPAITGKSKTIQLKVANAPEPSDEPQAVMATVKPGLTTQGSNHKTEAAQTARAAIPPLNPLQITGILTSYDGIKSTIEVLTTQRIQNESLNNIVSVSPQVNYTTEIIDNGFRLVGDFNREITYEIKIKTELQGVLGGKLKTETKQYVSFEQAGRSITFTSKRGVYLSGKGERNIGVRINNIPKVKIQVYKIYENNIISLLRSSGSFNTYEYDENAESYYEDSYYYSGYVNQNELGDLVYVREYETGSLPKENGSRLVRMNFEDKKKEYKGVYYLSIEDPEESWKRANKIVSITDMALIARQSATTVHVFCNSLKTAQPIAGAKITLISSKNAVLATAITDAEGKAVFTDIRTKTDTPDEMLITASLDEDFNYLHFRQSQVETSRFDVNGRTTNRSYDAFIYGDRQLYRPGDTVRFNCVVRTFDWQIPTEMPIRMRLKTPAGKEFQALKGNLNAQGAFAGQIHLPHFVPTGTWELEAFTADNLFIGSSEISVEEFMPERIKVNLQTNTTALAPGQKLTAKIKAQNFFGPPAANRSYEVEMQLQRAGFNSKTVENFDFSFAQIPKLNVDNVLLTGVTNENGEGEVSFSVPANLKNSGYYTGRVHGVVFDENGRPVRRSQSFKVFTQPYFVGVGKGESYFGMTAPVKIPLVAVDTGGKPANNVKVKLELLRYEWQTVIENPYGNYYRYKSQKREELLSEKNMTLSGITAYTFTPAISGEYALRIRLADENESDKIIKHPFVERKFYCYEWNTTTATSFQVNNEGKVDIIPAKNTAKPGETIDIFFKTPFDGKMLVTVENDSLLSSQYIYAENNAARLRFTLKEVHMPNIYVTATLFRPMDGKKIPFTVGHGFANIKVISPGTQLAVKLDGLPESMGSNRPLSITARTQPGAEVTLAVVDEGILSIKNTATPDPHGWFYAKRALEVNAYDIYGLLLPELGKPKSLSLSTGGGETNDEGGNNRRNNPMTSRRIKLVSFWSGLLKADSRGVVNYTVQVPQFSGSLRVMAVAYKGGAFGNAEKQVRVADPVVISTGLPRFLSPGDKVNVPVTFTNTTNQPLNGVATMRVSNNLKILDGNSKTAARQNVSLPANAESTVYFDLAATAVGEATVYTDFQTGAGIYKEITEIGIRPAAGLQRITENGMINAGAQQSLPDASEQFLAGTAQGKLIISRNPVVQFSDNLSYLLQYPHGCIEQTISTAFPQIYYSEITKLLDTRQTRTGSPTANVQAAIYKIQGMQLFSGGITYWPGSTGQVHPWGSVYAAHFLQEARQAGYDVSEAQLNQLYKYLNTLADNYQTVSYESEVSVDGLERSYNYNYKAYARREIIYALFVLAKAGRPAVAAMNYYKARPQLLTGDSKYLLAAAYGLTGDMQALHYLLPSGSGGGEFYSRRRETGGSFASPIRDKAIALYVLLTAMPDHPQIGRLSQQLTAQMKGEKWLSTQEQVFAFLALGKLAKQAEKSTVTADIIADGKRYRFDGSDLAIDLNKGAVQITTAGSGRLYYYREQSGIPITGPVADEDNNLKVRREYYDRNGKPLKTTGFTQNDLVYVKLTLSAPGNERIENIAVTDLLPAGFEIENPRLTSLPEISGWAKDISKPQYIDIRDDRVHFYVNLPARQTMSFYFPVRAVIPGDYVQGAASADAMYDGSYNSYFGAGRVQIRKRTAPNS